MSWRASPSRPAPPVTSTAPDSLFVGSSSLRPSRPGPRAGASGSSSSSSSSSTNAISLLTKQKAEFDDDRASIRSGKTARNASWSAAGSSGTRQRSTSTTSGVRTAASSRTMVKRTPSRENSGDSMSTKVRGKQKEETPSESQDSTTRPQKDLQSTLHVDKRPRLVKSASGSSEATATATAASTVTMESGRTSSWIWRTSNSAPPLPSVPANVTTSEDANSSSTETPPVPITSLDQPSNSGLDASNLSTSAASSTASQAFHTPDPSPRKPTRQASSEETSMPPPPMPKRGWFGSVKAPLPGTTSEPVASATSEETLQGLPTEPSSTPEGDSNRTPRPSRLPLPYGAPLEQAGASRRASWWGWGGEAEQGDASSPTKEGGPPADLEAPPSAPASDAGTASTDRDDGLGDTLKTPRPASENKSWLRSIWGEGGAAQAPEPSSGALTSNPTSIDAPPSPALSSTASISGGLLPQPIAMPVQALKAKASWFGRRNGDAASQTPPTAASSLNLPPALAAARPRGGVESSAASTRSHTSTTTTDKSAPASPHLGPQPDTAPVKPLTGSIRGASSPRIGAFEPDAPFENLVLPTFRDTFERLPRSRKPEKSKLTKAVSAVSAYFFHQPPPLERSASAGASSGGLVMGDKPVRDDPAAKLPKSLGIMDEPARVSRIKRVVTIGIHGWFPNPRLKSVFGEPTGTSVKFATMMHDAVHAYLVDHDMTSFNIQAIALEGQGEVDARVDKHYAQILAREEWVEALKKADAVFIATHSQGTVVSTQLLARLLDQGIIVGHKTHMLAMCGIAQGPFVYLYQSYALSPYFTYLESAPARELFEYQSPDSVHTIKFLESLRIILAHGIKITTIGSINDQVVPLYSALFSGISHPAILRAVYIDSQAFRTSDFLANLVVFAARLRNAGLHDHDLVYHVSEALAGALNGVGHSKIYEEEEVFTLAIRYHFETTSLHEPPTSLEHPTSYTLQTTPKLAMSFNPRDRRNPYLLTWALRGIIEDPKVRELFGNELNALREAFETWRPATKTLKEVKLKLEGIRMLPRANGGNNAGKL